MISDNAGRMLFEMDSDVQDLTSGKDISVKQLQSGTYYLTMICDDRRFTQSFTIQR